MAKRPAGVKSDDFQVVEVIHDVIQQDRQTVFSLARGTPAPARVDGNYYSQFVASLVERPYPLVVDIGIFRRIELEYLTISFLCQVVQLPEDIFHAPLDKRSQVRLDDKSIRVLFGGGQQIAVGGPFGGIHCSFYHGLGKN